MPRRALSRAAASPVTLNRKLSAATYIAVQRPSLSVDRGLVGREIAGDTQAWNRR